MVPPRVAFFAWEACWEKILTTDKLRARGLIIVNGCLLCLNAEESYNHLLLWCHIAYRLWCMIYSLLGIEWVVAGSVHDEIRVYDGLSCKRCIANQIPLIVFWFIWKERNTRPFVGKECNLKMLKDRWIYYFCSILLGHNINSDNFVNVIDTLTHL